MSCNTFLSPKCAFFGFDCLSQVGKEIKSLGVRKGLIVTDPSIVELGIEKKVEKMLEDEGLSFSLFAGVKPNPTVKNVEDGLKELKNSECDFLISIGGGSAHDCAKSISIVATNGGEITDYKGANKSKVPPLPLVAINTTAGTASEYTAAYVIVDEKTGTKYGSRDKNVISAIAVDDWSLMMTLPKKITAGTGMDALTHAIEAFSSVNGFEMTRALGLAAIREVFRFLPKAVNAPDEESRGGMAVAQYLAGMAFGNAGCGLVHSMSHQLSAVYDLPHGLSNAILLPVVMEFNCSREGAMRYAEIARNVFPFEADLNDDYQAAAVLIKNVRKLSKEIGIPENFSSLGAKKEDIPLLAEKAMQDGSLHNNIVQPTCSQIEDLYRRLI